MAVCVFDSGTIGARHTQTLPYQGLPVVASGPAAGGADLADLEGYIEALYEDDVAPRAAAASRIAALFVDLRNIQVGWQGRRVCVEQALIRLRTCLTGMASKPDLCTYNPHAHTQYGHAGIDQMRPEFDGCQRQLWPLPIRGFVCISPHSQGLVTHPSLLPTLARVLREDGRRSLEVAAAVASTFFGLSAMRQLHQTIRELQVGATLLELCQLEVTRTAQRMREDGLAASPASQVARMIAAATRAGPPLTER